MLAATAAATDLGSAGGVEYRVTARFFEPPEAPKATAMCPENTHISGGTFVVFDPESTDVYTWNSSIPVDAGDSDNRPDDGWRAKGSDIPGRAGVAATAMCTHENLRYRSKELPTELGFSDVRIGCGDDWHVTGGGISVPAGNNPTSSYPYDSGDPGKRPDDGWAAGLYIDDQDVEADLYAVCTRDSLEYHRAREPLDPGQGSALNADCSAKGHLLGAGARLVATPETTMITRTAAVDDAGEPGQAPDDGASAFGIRSGGSSGEGQLTTFAICAK